MNGMPGPGGSLGACCYCGKPFLAEILLRKRVKTVHIDGVEGGLPVHADCLAPLTATKEFTDLPAESPLRIAYEAQITPLTPNQLND